MNLNRNEQQEKKKKNSALVLIKEMHLTERYLLPFKQVIVQEKITPSANVGMVKKNTQDNTTGQSIHQHNLSGRQSKSVFKKKDT